MLNSIVKTSKSVSLSVALRDFRMELRSSGSTREGRTGSITSIIRQILITRRIRIDQTIVYVSRPIQSSFSDVFHRMIRSLVPLTICRPHFNDQFSILYHDLLLKEIPAAQEWTPSRGMLLGLLAMISSFTPFRTAISSNS